MATPIVLSADEFLDPISESEPSGASLAYEPAYDELREARRAEDDTPQGDWQRQPKVADWERVVALGTSLLKGRTKDLQIAAWVAEALARLHGFAGLRDGLRLVAAIQDAFWESYYPPIDEGDLESRFGPFLFLNGTLPLVVRGIPLTSGFGVERYSFLRWQESRATDNAGLKNPDLMETLIAEGKITSKQFDDQVAQTPRRYYEDLVEDLRQCLEAFHELDRSNDRHFGREAPGLVAIRKALDDCLKPLEPILAAKRAQEPDAEEEDSGTSDGPEEAPPDDEAGPGRSNGSELAAPRRKATASSGGPISSVEDARRRIIEAAAFLRQDDPISPVPYLVTRALRMGEVYGMEQPGDASRCEAPSSAVRQKLRRLAAEGEWDELLEQAEQAIARPEGRAWLDPHRFALEAMSSSSTDRTAAAYAVRSLLRAFLKDFPGLADAELEDGTPTASTETRGWLLEEIVPRAPEPSPTPYMPPPQAPPPSVSASTDSETAPDVWDEALGLVRSGRTAEGIEALRRAMNAAVTGRERFRRKLEMAELCLMVDHHRVALPLSEDLARQVDEFRLEQWEDEHLSARVWSALYRCLRAAAAVDGRAERLRQTFTRLCRVDINQAMMYGDDPGDR